MLIKIVHADERAIYVQIMDEVKRALVLGTLQPDDPLPSVRQLARDIKVNFNTVKKAYRELEREGCVYTERGLGTFAAHTSRIRADQESMDLARAVADRAVRDAFRHGLTPLQLITAIRDATGEPSEDEGIA